VTVQKLAQNAEQKLIEPVVILPYWWHLDYLSVNPLEVFAIVVPFEKVTISHALASRPGIASSELQCWDTTHTSS
jgi:hypothetical protein